MPWVDEDEVEAADYNGANAAKKSRVGEQKSEWELTAPYEWKTRLILMEIDDANDEIEVVAVAVQKHGEELHGYNESDAERQYVHRAPAVVEEGERYGSLHDAS